MAVSGQGGGRASPGSPGHEANGPKGSSGYGSAALRPASGTKLPCPPRVWLAVLGGEYLRRQLSDYFCVCRRSGSKSTARGARTGQGKHGEVTMALPRGGGQPGACTEGGDAGG